MWGLVSEEERRRQGHSIPYLTQPEMLTRPGVSRPRPEVSRPRPRPEVKAKVEFNSYGL